jgi:hydroxypyruvate isomerase
MAARLAAHLGVWSTAEPLLRHTARSLDPVDQIDSAAELGFAGVADNGLLRRSPEAQSRMGGALARRGLGLSSFALIPPGDPPFPWSAPGMDLAAGLAPALRAAERVGGGLVTVVVCEGQGPRVEQLARARDRLRQAAEIANRAGCALGLEPVSAARLPDALVERGEAAAALVAEVDHPGLRLILDTCHLHLAGEDAPALIRANAGRLAAVQIADMPGRVEPGAGELDLRAVLAELRDVGFGGWVEAEFNHSQPGREGEQSALAALRALADGQAGP